MAQNGGVSAARIVATQPTRPPSRTQPLSPPANNRDFVTLTSPRPDEARNLNEYIETPFRPQLPYSKSGKQRLKDEQGVVPTSPVSTNNAEIQTSVQGLALPGIHRPFGRSGSSRNNIGLFNTHLPITAQPVATFKKEKVADTVSDRLDSPEDSHTESIICQQCGRCKCEACRNPRPLPSKWICKDTCLCSAQSIVDYASCLCCVKGLFYHWAKDYEIDSDVSCADQPCSCVPHKRCLRWGCLGILSLVLPCLCCYFPMKSCVKLCEVCYAECSGHGCRCSHRRTAIPAELTQDKRLLDTNSDC